MFKLQMLFWLLLSFLILKSSFLYSSEPLATVVVTATKESRTKDDLPESVSAFNAEKIKLISPSHPSELLNRAPGVYLNNLGGEGHMTAIRQPMTTSGVYLFLEDGIPTRPTGYFNHNGLYEVNIPQANSVEVTRGPGSALYGSDAIGGIINTLTAAPPQNNNVIGINMESGAYGWSRMLLTGGTAYAPKSGMLVNVNVTENSGFREHSGYERQAVSLRWDSLLSNGVRNKSILALNNIDQTGLSGLYSEDFKAHSRKNYFTGDIARRQVDAVRLSTELDIDLDELSLFSVTPYFRQNQMDLMPYWMLSFDPQFSSTTFQSYGLLTKYRHNFNEAGVIFITGLDIDVTPSSYKEEQLNMVLDKNIYVDYSRTGRRNYDFNATQNSVSPYVHAEWALSEVLIASFGLRYDWFNVVYQDDLDNSIPEVIGWQKWYRPDNQRIDYDQWSPKLGLVYHLTPNLNIYSNFRHAFRVPTAGQLFRSGSSLNTDKLSPVKADSFEVGLRGNVDMPLRYELALYHMIISDDVVNYLEGNDRKVTNAGETQHDGVEMLLAGDITGEFGFNVALSYTQQKYNDFSYVCYPPSCNQATTLNWKGNKLMQAPDILANVVLEYQPEQLAALHFELEMEHIGSYFLDQTNADKYEGYRVYHLRSRYDLNDHWQIYGRLNNLTNHYYSTSTGIVDPVNGVEYRPGMPLSFFMGFSFKW